MFIATLRDKKKKLQNVFILESPKIPKKTGCEIKKWNFYFFSIKMHKSHFKKVPHDFFLYSILFMFKRRRNNRLRVKYGKA